MTAFRARGFADRKSTQSGPPWLESKLMKFTRRQIGAGALASPALLATQAWASPAVSPASIARPFPRGFRWGAATAAYQIEGAPSENGKGPSIWDVFAHTPGKIKDGSTGDVACDSYHRYKEDRQLLQGLGANAYRLSISWPRIFPNGKGKPNAKGVDHYKRVLDDLLAHGIEPYVTLFHWDLPAALPGGWRNRDTALRFADYAGYMAGQVSDRVTYFMTTNEISSFVTGGYLSGEHAPGLHVGFDGIRPVIHHALLAHGLGVRAIRANARSRTQVGLAENPRIPVPVIETPEHIAAAAKALHALNESIAAPIFEGGYSPKMLQAPGMAELVREGDNAVIGSPIDFAGLNIYTGVPVRADPGPTGFAMPRAPRSYPKMMLPWLAMQPEALYWGARLVSEVWKPKAIYITENGCPSDDVPREGRIEDTDRTMFLRQYLTQLQRATSEGYPVKGYFAWSLMDNFEWAEGHAARFGLYYTDYVTQRRIPKLSAEWFKQLIAANQLV